MALNLLHSQLVLQQSNITLISDWSFETCRKLKSAFSNENSVVLDAEGVDLSREGAISIVQLATREHRFIFDVLDKNADDSLVAWLRGILEDETVTKIIHDCRMDSDALLHHLQIRLSKVQSILFCQFIHDFCCVYSIRVEMYV
jgi:ribonuclease D